MCLGNVHLVKICPTDKQISQRSTLLTVIEPIPEAMEAILNQVFCCPEVKPRID